MRTHITRGLVASYAAGHALAANHNWTVGQSVETARGRVVEGHAAPNVSEVSEYLGIPFALPPVGDLRWREPQPYNGTGTVNGTNYGYACVTADSPAIDLGVLEPLGLTPATVILIEQLVGAGAPENEDCLTLNVWTKPQSGEDGKAVMVWIHGGGYKTGSSSLPWYDGEFIADQEDVVVVTFNYRLNIFGFPGAPSATQNLGMLDQRLAVEWVRDNIALFGGDPARITLFGEGAGGSSVDLYSYAWADDPIARGIIAMSGDSAGILVRNASFAATQWLGVARSLGCNATASDAVLGCMQQASVDDLSAAVARIADGHNITDFGDFNGRPGFGLVQDDTLVWANYSDRDPASVPLLVGSNDNEVGLFRLVAPNISADALEALDRLAFTCPTGARAAWSVQKGNPTWRYRWFGGDWPNLRLTTTPSGGAWRGSELAPLFGTTPQTAAADTSEQAEISRYIRGAWAAFARDPEHGLSEYDGGWPRYSTERETLVRLGYRNQTGSNLGVGNEYDGACQPPPPVVTSPGGGSDDVPDAAGMLGPRAGFVGLLAIVLAVVMV